MLGRNIAEITRAIKENRQVRLKKYHSLNSDTVANRHVEPIGFVGNMHYLTAYEPETDRVLQFKPDRAAGVEILERSQQYTHIHQNQQPDVFGMNGTPVVSAALRLTGRGKHLLREEFPMSASGIEEPSGNAPAHWTGTVKGFEGVGRFVMGLPEEVKVEAPSELKNYIDRQLQKVHQITTTGSKKVFH